MQRSRWYIRVKTSKYLFFQTHSMVRLDFLKIAIVPSLSRAFSKLNYWFSSVILKFQEFQRRIKKETIPSFRNIFYRLFCFNSERLFRKFLIPKIPLTNLGIRKPSVLYVLFAFTESEKFSIYQCIMEHWFDLESKLIHALSR